MISKKLLILLGILIASAGSHSQILAVQTSKPAAAQDPPATAETKTPARQQESSSLVTSVDSIGLTVHDMDAEVKFFSDVLSFKKVSDEEIIGEDFEKLLGVFGLRIRVVRMQLGSEFITLTQFLAPRGRPIPVESKSNDGWFQHMAIAVSDMDAAYAHLRTHKVEHASTGPQTLPDWNPKAAGIKAFYFKDPEGHVIEVINFPKGKGDDRWRKQGDQGDGDKLFLGIAHSAIVVADTETALKFYRDLLGFKVAGNSENFGPEQERLNNVFGARLRITSLRADEGPGIELLEYLSPTDGLPYPSSTRMNDLWSWRIRLTVKDIDASMAASRKAKVDWVSPGVVDIVDDEIGIDSGMTIADPFGHRMMLVDPK